MEIPPTEILDRIFIYIYILNRRFFSGAALGALNRGQTAGLSAFALTKKKADGRSLCVCSYFGCALVAVAV
jgi:hypothetical protein